MNTNTRKYLGRIGYFKNHTNLPSRSDGKGTTTKTNNHFIIKEKKEIKETKLGWNVGPKFEHTRRNEVTLVQDPKTGKLHNKIRK